MECFNYIVIGFGLFIVILAGVIGCALRHNQDEIFPLPFQGEQDES